MGYVFTPEEYEKGRIPTIQDYQRAIDTSRRKLQDLFNKKIICSANIHGSIFNQDYRTGSDLDILVIIESVESEKYLRELSREIKETTFVPIEFVPVIRKMAERGHHGLDYFYVLYIKTFCQAGIIGKNPTNMISPSLFWADPKKEVLERFRQQITKLSKHSVNLPKEFDVTRCQFLEKIIRQPIYAAIDMLRLKNGNYPSENDKPLSKIECCKLYERIFPKLPIDDLFEILKTRQEYHDFLKIRKNVLEYKELLKKIEGNYPRARRFIEQNFVYLCDAF